MTKKILFLINGLGLGNSTRCSAIIEKLISKNCEVSVITSGNGEWFFQNKIFVKNLFVIDEIKYGSVNNELNILETLKETPKIFKTIKQNSKTIKKVINEMLPNVIVTDSVYLTNKISNKKTPIVSINNSDIVIQKFKSFSEKPKSIYMQLYCVEQLDYFYHKIVPDKVISPDLIFEKSKSSLKKFNRISPIVRNGIKKNFSKSPVRGGIMLSGSNFGIKVNLKKQYSNISLDIIGREEPPGWQPKNNIKFHGKIRNNVNLLNSLDFCVVNGGYSAISELFWANIPMIVVPVPNHAEQWINAKQIQDSGCGIIGNENNYEDLIPKLINDYSTFKNNFLKYSTNDNGADEATKIILNI